MEKADLYRGIKYAALGLCLAMGSKLYDGPQEQLIHHYAWDVLGPIIYYNGVFQPSDSRILKSAVTLAVPSLYEFGQFLGVLPGTFDPKDFLAYGLGVAAAVGIDTLLQKNPVTLEQIAGV